jgi:hypothetical protein
MDKLIRTMRAAGTQQLTAVVLTENARMRKLGHALGMRETPVPGDTSTLALVLDLQPSGEPA